MGIMPDRFNSTSAPKYNPPNYSYPERRSAEIATLRAVLIECRDWFESPGGDPDSGEILRHINDALGDRGSMSTDGEGHDADA